MNIIGTMLSNFFGNKSTKDIQEVTPLVEKIKSEYELVVNLTNDELRAHSTKLKEEIRQSIKESLEKIDS
jgi:preprotein translocase subunit SecA